MGQSELREVFSQAGAKFTDRPEYLEERADWATKDVHLYPNSRFGIGVLSYFMLADEIEVVTRRMSRRGHEHAPTLKVMIAGPGHLFRIEEEHDDRPTGTTVTLYLRDGENAPSCVEVLRRLLGIAEFETTAEHEDFTHTWRPFGLRQRSSPGPRSPGIDVSGGLVHSTPGDNGQVVWCAGGGGLLVDGIHAAPPIPRGADPASADSLAPMGAVVNLTRNWSPQLTVDRASVLEDVSPRVERLLTDAIPVLLEAMPTFLTRLWLLNLAGTVPSVADAIAAVMADWNIPLPTTDGLTDMASIGCFPSDTVLIHRLSLRARGVDEPMSGRRFPEHILLWRLIAHCGTRVLDGLATGTRTPAPARPSDSVLFDLDQGDFLDEGSLPGAVAPRTLARVAMSAGKSVGAVAHRYRTLGYRIAGADPAGDDTTRQATDPIILSRDLDGLAPGIDQRHPVPPGHVISAHFHTGIKPDLIVDRLRWYAFDVSGSSDLPKRLSDHDVTLAGALLDGLPPWLPPAEPVDLGRILFAAHLLELSPAEVARRYDDLNFPTPPGVPVPDWLPQVVPALRRIFLRLDEIQDGGTVALSQIVRTAVLWGVPPREAARRIGELGRPVPDEEVVPPALDGADLELLPRDWLEADMSVGRVTVSAATLFFIADRTGRDLTDIVERLTEWAFDVRVSTEDVNRLDNLDRRLVDMGLATGRNHSEDDRLVHSLLETARQVGRPVSEVSRRLRRLGVPTPGLAHLTEPLSQLDFRLLTVAGHAVAKLPPGSRVPVALVAAAADLAGETVAAATTRLVALGYSVAFAGDDHVDGFDSDDLHILRALELERPVSVRDVIRIALRYEMKLIDVARRIEGMGLSVPDLAAALPAVLELVPWQEEHPGTVNPTA
ncbi:hypothetical protein FHS29_003549 [Saccharothrix tamanrassetensis]|uniref:wHTH-Hsp90 Na associated domain-containing protein n=1 Tax=Saccharothrix tamanrassetensis TaxID=1051531 RepID=A0A841CN33_9PSEU|nr:hypothetical protein [Saccharothrix tamanrassetensis]MBB5956956.1 hypothetical protein [Saccharothrix tamanrassetensis]